MSQYIKYIALDATHLKGMYKGILMSAVTLDGDGHVIIVCQAITDIENFENWNYFFKHLKNAGLDANIEFLISDRDKGLMNAASLHFEGVPHSKCLQHLLNNFHGRFGNKMATTNLEKMARSYTQEKYMFFRNEILTYQNSKPMIDYIESCHPDMWCRSLFKVGRYGVITSNTAECLWAALSEQRKLPVLDLLIYLENYVMQKRFKYYNMNNNRQTFLCKKGSEIFEAQSKKMCNYIAKQTGHSSGYVEYKGEIKRQYSIDLSEKTCTCGYFQEHKMPCGHVLHFVTRCLKDDPYRYCSEIHTTDYLKNIYKEIENHASIPTVKEHLYKYGTSDIIPKIVTKQKGRKRIHRYKSETYTKKKEK